MSSPNDKFSENIWFVWSKTSYDGDKWRCHHGDKQTTNKREYRAIDKAPCLSIRIVIWILPSDTVFVNSIKISANTETAMLSIELLS